MAIFLTQDFLPPQLALRVPHRRGAARRHSERRVRALGSLRRGARRCGRWPAGCYDTLGWIPFFGTTLSGPGLAPAALVLAIMILPTVAAISQDALRLVPYRVKEAAYGLGTTKWEAILKVMLPTAATGIFGALVLGFGRALGETMALAMLIGNSNQISLSLFAPANTLAALLALNFPEAGKREVEVLMYAALVLLAITLVVNVAGEMIMALSARKTKAMSVVHPPMPAVRLQRSAFESRSLRSGLLTRRRLGGGDHRRHPARLGALHAHRARRRPARLGGVDRAAAGRLRDGRRLRQRHRRHARDGRHRRRCSASRSVSWPPSTWPSSGPTRRLSQIARFATKTLTGMPSILAGVFAYAVVVLLTGKYSAPAGGLALAVLMLPTVILTAEEAIKAVPKITRDAAYGMGCTRSQVVWKVLLPTAMPGILTGVMLAVARAAGETAPLLFTALFSSYWLFENGVPKLMQPTASLAVLIYNFSGMPVREPDRARLGGLAGPRVDRAGHQCRQPSGRPAAGVTVEERSP